jgi:phage baseplate assembly protein gpV
MNHLLEHRERGYSENPAFRVGIVQQQDAAHAKVRVVFPDYDEVVSWWLPVIFAKTQNDKAYWIPDVGEQVVCLMDLRDEAGAVLGAIYSNADLPPVNSADKFHLAFKDGTSVDYDRGAHVLELKFQDHGEIKYDGGGHALTMNLPTGATFTLTAGAAQVQIDANGNVIIKAAGQVQLGSGQLAGVARLGDVVRVQDDEGGMLTGSIVTASIDVLAG